MKTRILVVDDERAIRRALELSLSRAGYEVVTAATAEAAQVAAAAAPPDLALIDLVLPDGDGADLTREIRSWSSAPILLLSAVDEEREKVRALDAGADDYLTKPFGVEELLARVRALLRRAEGGSGDRPALINGPIAIDAGQHLASVDGHELRLTPTEFRLLRELVASRGRVLTHAMLLRQVWGPGYVDDTAVLRVHVARLRDKLEEAGLERDVIETMTGVGYRMPVTGS
jgi:two-component system, OmpR family, KDP operon response regulator KdpE